VRQQNSGVVEDSILP